MFFVVSLCVMCVASAALLFGRIAVTLAIRLVPGGRTVFVAMHWLHPSMLRGELDAKSKVLRLWLFGRFRVWPAPMPRCALRLFPKRTSPSAGPASGSHEATVDTKAPPPQETRDIHSGNGEDRRSHEKTETAKGPSLKEKNSAKINTIKKSGFVRAFYFIRNTSWRGKTLRWLQRCTYYLPRLCRIHSASLHVRLGLSDPALTGKIFGCWTGVKNGIFSGNAKGSEWTFDPVFNEEYLSVEGGISLRSSLIRFVMLFALACATFPYFATLKTWRASKR